MMIKKIKVKLRDSFKFLLVKLTVVINQPALTALVLAMFASRLGQKNQYRVLVMGRSIFTDDIRSMVEFSGQIEYQVIHLSFFQVIFDHFVSRTDRTKITESNYHNVTDGVIGRQRYRAYLEKMFEPLKQRLGFQAVISGNIGYIVQQELAKICLEKNVAFVVLHKEAVVVSQAYGNFLNVYKHHHFMGHKVMFYNKQCMQGFLDLHIPGLTPDKAVCVGIPRFDNYFLRKEPDERVVNQVVFFSFLPRYSSRFLTTNEATLQNIETRAIEFFKIVYECAQRHPEVHFIVKTKMSFQYVDFPTKILRTFYPDGIKNLSIVNTGDPSELIHNALAVIGFNSTTLIEALIAGKPIISPYFGDIITDRDWSFFQKYSSLVCYAQTSEDLENCLFNKSNNLGYSDDTKKAFLEEYISISHGGASKFAEAEIIKTITNLSK
ncbi:MAG: hypothetical protein HUU49_00700 [Candidatus Buchananbacteria bacterium]|nr:hypothetical protein [Candidatus Buchananbacteria bacterium]